MGSKHDLTFVYEKTSTNSWTCYVLADASEVNDGVSVNSAGKETAIGSEGEAFLLYTLEMEFDTDGTLTNYTPTRNPTTDWKFIGAEDSPTLAFNFGLDRMEIHWCCYTIGFCIYCYFIRSKWIWCW